MAKICFYNTFRLKESRIPASSTTDNPFSTASTADYDDKNEVVN